MDNHDNVTIIAEQQKNITKSRNVSSQAHWSHNIWVPSIGPVWISWPTSVAPEPLPPHPHTHTHTHTLLVLTTLVKHKGSDLDSVSLWDKSLNLGLILHSPAALHPIINSYGSPIIWKSEQPQITQVSNYGARVIRNVSQYCRNCKWSRSSAVTAAPWVLRLLMDN